MTASLHETNTLKMNEYLQERGAIGARLLSMKQESDWVYILQLQTLDDRRITVTFRTELNMKTSSTVEFKIPGDDENKPAGG